MSMGIAFPCRRASSKEVGGGRWVGEISKVAAALEPRGISASRRAKGRRLIAYTMFSNVMRVVRTSKYNLPQSWLALICLLAITLTVQVLTGLSLPVSYSQDLDFNTTIFTFAVLFFGVSEVVDRQWQHKTGTFVVAAAAASVFVWLYCKQNRLNEISLVFETGVILEMNSKQPSLPSKEIRPSRNMVANRRPASNMADDLNNASSASEAVPGQNYSSYASAESPSTRWEGESTHLSGTAAMPAIPYTQELDRRALRHSQQSVGTSESISAIQGPTMDKNDKNSPREKISQRILRRVGSFISLPSSTSGPGHSPSDSSKKVLTIGAPSDFRHVSHEYREVPHGEGGVPLQNRSPMNSRPIGAQQTASLGASRDDNRLKMGNPYKSKSVPNLSQRTKHHITTRLDAIVENDEVSSGADDDRSNKFPEKGRTLKRSYAIVDSNDVSSGADDDRSDKFPENARTLKRSYGSRSIADLRVKTSHGEAETFAPVNYTVKRKPVHVKHDRPLQLGQGQFTTSTTHQLEQASPTGLYPEPARSLDDLSRDHLAKVTTPKSDTTEERTRVRADPSYGQAERNPSIQEFIHYYGSDGAENEEQEMRLQQEAMAAAVARRGSCMLMNFNGTGVQAHFKVITSPEDCTTKPEPATFASSDTVPSSFTDSQVPESGWSANAVMNDPVLGSGGGFLDRNPDQDNRMLTMLEFMCEPSEASDQVSPNHESSGAHQMPGSSASRQLATGGSLPRSPSQLPSTDTRKPRESSFFGSLFKKEPSIAALDEYSRREYASKGVDPKDPDAAAKLKISTRKLPPEAPKPASKEPKKKKGGGPVETTEPLSRGTPGKLRKLASLESFGFRSKEDRNSNTDSKRSEGATSHSVNSNASSLTSIDEEPAKSGGDLPPGQRTPGEEMDIPPVKTSLTLAQRRRQEKRKKLGLA